MRRALLWLLLGSVGGGLPPRRPDQADASSSAGIAPGASSGITRARLVLVSGPGAGVFLYSGTPGKGDLVESVTEASADLFGNPTFPGFGSYDNVFGGTAQLHGAILKLFAGVVLTSQLGPAGLSVFNSHGALIYNVDTTRAAQFLYADTGSATQGALVCSESQNSGTDQFGNGYVSGTANYVIVPGHGVFAVSLIAGVCQFFTAATVAGPFAQGAGVSIASGALAGLPTGSLVLASQNASVLAVPADNQVYRVERIRQSTTATQQFTLASAVPITGLSRTLGVGTYHVHLRIFYAPSGVVGSTHQVAFAFTGTATANVNGECWQAQAANAVQQTALNGGTHASVLQSPTHVAFAGWTDMEADIVVTVAGTLTATVTLQTAGDDVTTSAGTYWEINPES